MSAISPWTRCEPACEWARFVGTEAVAVVYLDPDEGWVWQTAHGGNRGMFSEDIAMAQADACLKREGWTLP